MNGEEEEDWKDDEGEPDGQGDEDCVDEAGCWNWRGEDRVWALEMLVLNSSRHVEE